MTGEHIRTRRGGRWDHAIDCGDQTVIHLAGDGADGPPRVRRSYRPEFLAGAEAVETVTHRERTFPAREVVARAYSRIADPALAAMFRDSEAFAAWCATGRLPTGPPNVAVPALLPAPVAAPAPRRKAGDAAGVRRSASRAPAKAKRTAPGRAAPKPVPDVRAKAKAKAKAKGNRPASRAKAKGTRPAPRATPKAPARRRASPRRTRRR